MSPAMFSSAQQSTLARRVLNFVWPRRGLRRAWSYLLLRLSRLKACPHKVSIGFAAGAFASFLPLVGFHFVIAAALALVVRGSVIASVIGTVVGNPITFPLIWFATYRIGVVLTGQSAPYDHGDVGSPAGPGFGFNVEYFSGVWQSLGSAFWPMLVGALPLGLFCATVCYALVYVSIRGLRRPAPSGNSRRERAFEGAR
jgi:uncharacterized protein